MFLQSATFLIVAACILAELSCSGCRDPALELQVWTDNSTIWKCEKMQRIFVDTCRDIVEVYCNRQQDLGGSLYIMTFPRSPENFSIKPDHVRKTKGSSVLVTMNCVVGQWTIRNRTRAQTHILCDQFITEENRPSTEKMSYSSTMEPFNDIDVIKSTPQLSSTPLPYDFPDLIYPNRRKRGKYIKFKASLIVRSSKKKARRFQTKTIKRKSVSRRMKLRKPLPGKVLIKRVYKPLKRKKSIGKRRRNRHSFKKLKTKKSLNL